jgi:hypothetical protein
MSFRASGRRETSELGDGAPVLKHHDVSRIWEGRGNSESQPRY